MTVSPRRRGLVRALGVLCGLVPVASWAGASARAGESAPAAAHARVPLRDRTTWDSVFTAEQAGRGETTYKQLCARCHQESMAGANEAPALTGSAFMSSWNGQTLEELHDRIRTSMPTDTPGVYGRQQVTDVIAHMLRVNGFPTGTVPLTHVDEALKGIRFISTKP